MPPLQDVLDKPKSLWVVDPSGATPGSDTTLSSALTGNIFIAGSLDVSVNLTVVQVAVKGDGFIMVKYQDPITVAIQTYVTPSITLFGKWTIDLRCGLAGG